MRAPRRGVHPDNRPGAAEVVRVGDEDVAVGRQRQAERVVEARAAGRARVLGQDRAVARRPGSPGRSRRPRSSAPGSATKMVAVRRHGDAPGGVEARAGPPGPGCSDTAVRAPVVGFTRITPPAAAERVLVGHRMLPFGLQRDPERIDEAGPAGGARVLGHGRPRARHRVDPEHARRRAPVNAPGSTTRNAPLASRTTPCGSTKLGPPVGLEFADRVVRAPVSGSTRISPPLRPRTRQRRRPRCPHAPPAGSASASPASEHCRAARSPCRSCRVRPAIARRCASARTAARRDAIGGPRPGGRRWSSSSRPSRRSRSRTTRSTA